MIKYQMRQILLPNHVQSYCKLIELSKIVIPKKKKRKLSKTSSVIPLDQGSLFLQNLALAKLIKVGYEEMLLLLPITNLLGS